MALLMLAAMPPAESLWRPLHIKMQAWPEKRAAWQTAVETVLVAPDAAELPSDPFARLERLKGVALIWTVARALKSAGRGYTPAFQSLLIARDGTFGTPSRLA